MFRNKTVGECILLLILILALVFGVLCFEGWLVMLLWNATVTVIFGLTEIGFWRAVGVMLLCNLLFTPFIKINTKRD